MRRGIAWAGVFATAWLLAPGGPMGTLEAQEVVTPAAPETAVAEPERPEVAAVRKTAEEFVRAFNAGDAKAVAALWTPEGDYSEADGETIVGREMIEQAYAEFFKENPKATIEITVESVRVLGPNVAVEEGTSRLRRAGEKEDEGAAPSRYSALHVRGEEGWRMASVTEWPSDPAVAVSLEDVEWLVGDWEVASDEASARVSYEWDDSRAFLRGRYTLKRGEGDETSGTETIARDPAGGLRSWRFDASGAFAESAWIREEDHWLIETAATLTDGSEATAVVLLTPLDKDSFLWQAMERSVGGTALPGTPPLKITRVGASSADSPKTEAGR